MEENQQSRIYAVTTKVTAILKAKFLKEAKKHNLSLSEWICGTLDMSLNAFDEVQKLEEFKRLKAYNNKNLQIINHLNLEIKELKEEITRITSQQNETNSNEVEIVYYIKNRSRGI